GYPDPSAIPRPFAADPNVARSGRDNDRFHRRWRRRLGNIHRVCLRYGSRSTDGTRRVNHKVNDRVAHTGVAQINDIRRTEMIDGVRIAYLTDDDIVTHTR